MSTLFRFIPRVGASIDPRLDRLIAEHEVTVGRADLKRTEDAEAHDG